MHKTQARGKRARHVGSMRFDPFVALPSPAGSKLHIRKMDPAFCDLLWPYQVNKLYNWHMAFNRLVNCMSQIVTFGMVHICMPFTPYNICIL